MPDNKTIPGLDPADDVDAADLFGIRKTGDDENKKATAEQVKDYVGEKLVCSVERSTSQQSFPLNAHTEVIHDVEVSDPNNWYNPANGRFTPNKAGWYTFYGIVRTVTADVVALPVVTLRKNGVELRSYSGQVINATLTGGIGLPVSGKYYLNGTTDYVSLFFYHNSAGARLTHAAQGLNQLQVFQ
ncbi:hypothetical protein ACS5NO_32210 [Larkinella sp. GY13]|uniref:hypothetical protein n=1 Tax=Larkinella sp. GY13 TaxID=3453720 RepID=UPI003EEC9DF4